MWRSAMKDTRVQYLRDAIFNELTCLYIEYETAQRIMKYIDSKVGDTQETRAKSVSAKRIQELGEIFGVYNDGVFKMHSASLRDLVRVALAESA
jgi:hypothetical protein